MKVTLLIALARSDGEHFALIGLLSGSVGDDDAGGGPWFFLFQALDDHAIVSEDEVS